jgi:hypothetical protein
MSERRQLVFGIDEPPTAGPELWECGWHPVCGHVRHAGLIPRLELPPSPGLVYGALPRADLEAALGSCEVCAPPITQAELWGEP